jgi:hypothetical protein
MSLLGSKGPRQPCFLSVGLGQLNAGAANASPRQREGRFEGGKSQPIGRDTTFSFSFQQRDTS